MPALYPLKRDSVTSENLQIRLLSQSEIILSDNNSNENYRNSHLLIITRTNYYSIQCES